MSEMVMAHSLGFGARCLHWRDGAAGALGSTASAPLCNRRMLQRMVVLYPRRSLSLVSVHARSSIRRSQIRSSDQDQVGTSSEYQTMSVPAATTIPPSQPAYIGSPLLWVGVGVGLSVLFSWAANYAKKQAMQQALKTMMGGNGSGQFGSMPPGTPFQFPPIPQPVSAPQTVSSPISATQASVSSTVVETASRTSQDEAPVSENNKPVFADVDVEAEAKVKAEQVTEPQQETEEKSFFKDAEVKDSGAGFTWNTDSAASTSSDGKTGSFFSVEALEKMLEDPSVQQMIYPYLPPEMRNPSTFKWMMQNPQFKVQLQEMLNNMTEDGAWKSGQMSDMLKNFNPNNQELKQQFEQIGLSPEEVMAKMVANPEIAMAFQNPKIQAALVDCSQNPANIAKYQSDKEIMDVFNKIAELFPMKGF